MRLLDCTIRDGSYAVDFKWTQEDVAKIITRLERLRFEYIEIGHGLGLNASSSKYGFSLLSDLEYMNIARANLKKSKYGFFCIPNIANLDDIKKAKDNGVSFLRVGINADTPDLAVPYIREAKKQGLEVMTNYMKSYAVSCNDFVKAAFIASDNGADAVYIVDSAGCMVADDIKRIYDAVKNTSDIKLGFHGHNNIGLAVSNSLLCAQLGFDFIDCTFQGLGRSIGNASSEQLIMSLKKYDFCKDVDIPCLLEWGYDSIRNVIPEKCIYHPLDLICGYTGFHSSFLKDIYKCCNEKHVDPMRLIIAYCEKNRLSMDYELLCKCADSLRKDNDENPYSFRKYFSDNYND
ncbi:MAG: hypothetical protein PUC37_05465 [Spirochaetales bacterium]|nr:hypothetical protein [Spirochaetales bacterium]